MKTISNEVYQKVYKQFNGHYYETLNDVVTELARYFSPHHDNMKNRFNLIVSLQSCVSDFPLIQQRLETFRLNLAKEKNCTIAQRVIPAFALMNDGEMHNIIISNCEDIEEYAFLNSKIQTVTFCVDRILHISALAFCNCLQLKEIHFIGSGEIVLDDFAFYKCPKLTIIDNQIKRLKPFPDNAIVCNEKSFLKNELKKMIEHCKGYYKKRLELANYVLPFAPECIFPEYDTHNMILVRKSEPYHFFYSLMKVAYIKIPEKDNVLLSHSFYGCFNLEKIVIYGNPIIERYAVYHCHNLKKVIFKNMDCMKNVQQGAFCGNGKVRFEFILNDYDEKIQQLIDSGYYTNEPVCLNSVLRSDGESADISSLSKSKKNKLKNQKAYQSFCDQHKFLFDEKKYTFDEIKFYTEQLRNEKRRLNSILKYSKKSYLAFYFDNSLHFEPELSTMENLLSSEDVGEFMNFCFKLGHLYSIFKSDKKLNQNMNEILSSDLDVASKSGLKNFFDCCSSAMYHFGSTRVFDFSFKNRAVYIYSEEYKELQKRFKNKDILMDFISFYCFNYYEIHNKADFAFVNKKDAENVMRGISAATALIECHSEKNGEEFFDSICSELENYTYPGYPDALINVLNYQYFNDFDLVKSAVLDLKHNFIEKLERVMKDIEKIVYPYQTDKQ